MTKEVELEMAIREAPENAMIKRKRKRKDVKAKDSAKHRAGNAG